VVCQSNQIKEDEVGGACGTHGGGERFLQVLVGRSESKIPLGRPRCRWEDNIKMDLREIGLNGAHWIQRTSNRVRRRAFVNRVINRRVP